MKKKNNSLIIAIAALALLLVVYFIVSSAFSGAEDAVDTDSTSTQSYTVSNIDSTKINSITYTNGGVSYAFSLKDKVWSYDADEHFDVDETAMADIVSAVSGIRAEKKISEAAVDSAEYGLDSPLHTVTVKTTDGTSFVFKIGAYNKHADLNYMTADGDGSVYMVSPDFVALFSGELYDLLALEKMESITASTVNKITADGPFGRITLSVTKDEDGKAVYTHKNALGGEAVLDADAGAAIVSALCSVKLTECVDHYVTEDERAQYALDDENKIKIEDFLLSF